MKADYHYALGRLKPCLSTKVAELFPALRILMIHASKPTSYRWMIGHDPEVIDIGFGVVEGIRGIVNLSFALHVTESVA